MKKFENITTLGNEEAVKIGSFIPDNGAGLAYFLNESLTPAKNLNVVDLSETIAENKIASENKTKLFYANENGMLQDENGNINFNTSDLILSDRVLSRDYVTERIDSNSMNENDFMHYYYVSRYFISAPTGYGINDLDDYHDISYYKNLNIKVLDSENKEYIKKKSSLYSKNNTERLRVVKREYARKHPEIDRNKNRRKRALKRSNGFERYTEAQVLELYGTDCYLCNTPIDMSASRRCGDPEWQKGLHIEHVVDIALGGPDTLSNVRPSHAICNLTKKPREMV